MAGHNWELVRDLGVAQRAGDSAAIQRLTLEIQAGQLACSHVVNPDRVAKPDLPLVTVGLTSTGDRCYKCGAWMKPGIVKGSYECQTKAASGDR